MEKGQYAKADSLLEIAQNYDPYSEQIIIKRLTALYYLGEYKKIIKISQQAIENKKDNPDIYIMMADSYYKLNKQKKALKILKNTVDISDNLKKAKIYYQIAKIYVKEDNLAKANDFLELSLNQARDNISLLYLIALEFSELKNNKRFIQILQKINKIDPSYTKANQYLGEHYFSIKDYLKAITYLENLIESSKYVYPSSLKKLIISYYFEEDYNKIIEVMNNITDLSYDKTIKKILFISYFKLQDFEKAIALGEDIIKNNLVPDQNSKDETYEILAVSEYYLHNYNRSYQFFSKIKNGKILLSNLHLISYLSYFNKNIALLNKLSTYTNDIKNDSLKHCLKILTAHYFASVDSLEKSKNILHDIDLNSTYNNNLILENLAFIYLKAYEDIETAKKFLNQRDNPNTSTNMWIGNFFLRQDLNDKAINFFKKEIVLDKNNIEPYFKLGIIYNKTGKKEEEIDILKEAVNKFPNNSECLNWLGYAYVEENKNLDKAVELIQKAISLDSTNVYIWDSLAWAFYKMGKYEKALKSMKLVIDNNTQDSVISYHLGNIYWKIGKIDKALTNWKRAIKINNNKEGKKMAEEMLKKINKKE